MVRSQGPSRHLRATRPPKVESVDLVGGSVRMDSEGEEIVYQRHKSWSKSLQCSTASTRLGDAATG